MNYRTSFEGLRQNAASGAVWLCSKEQAGTVAGLLDSMIVRILRNEMGFASTREWVRDNLRLPFLNWLFEDAVYTREMHTHERTEPVLSAKELTAGEARAVLQWLRLTTARNDLREWIEDSEVDVWRSEKLL